MRRQPNLRNENMLRLALDEITRLKAGMSRFGDGQGLAITTTTPGSTPGTGGPTVPGPGVEPLPHVLYGSKHTNSLRVTDGGGLLAAYEAGQVWVNGTFYSIAAGTTALTDATTNYVFVNSSGVVADNTTGFPTDGIPMATVVTVAGAITTINDRRSYLNAGAWTSMSGILTTRGDLLTRNATQLIRLGIGAAGSLLRADGTDPAWTINPTIAGYVRIGSIAAPTNVTAGDLTVARLFVGDAVAIAGIEALITGDLQVTTSVVIGRTGVEAGTLIVYGDVAFGSGYFRFVNPNVVEALAYGDNITLRMMTNASVNAGVVPGAVELQAGAGLNSQGGAINITAGAGVAGAGANHAGGIIGITAGDAVGTGVGGIINLTTGKSPTGTDGAISMRLRGSGIADISPEWRVQQDQDGAGDFQSIFTVINTGMSALLGGLALGNMLDLQNEGDNAPEFGAIGGKYADWTATAYDTATHDSRNVDYLISPRDKAIYLWNTHVHGTGEEFLKVFWTGNVLKIITDASGTGTDRELTIDAGNGDGAAALNLFGYNVVIRARDATNGIFLDLPDAAGASFVKVRDSAFAERAEIDSDGNAEFFGYARVGSVAAPTNVTAGDLTAVRLFVGDATGFSLAVVAGAPRITFDTNDYLEFNQATDTLTLVVGSASKFSYIGGLTDEFRFDAVARFQEPAVLSGTVVLDTRDAGAGAVARMDIISHDAIAGIDWYRKSATDTRIKNAFEMENGVNQDPDLVMYRFTGAGGVEVKDEVLRFINSDGAVRIAGAKQLQFRDNALVIYSAADGYLDIGADTGVRVTTPTFSASAAATVADALTIGPSDFGMLAHLVLQPASGNNRVGLTTGTGRLGIFVGDPAGANFEALSILHASGYVGILNSAPQVPLDVTGLIRTSAGLEAMNQSPLKLFDVGSSNYIGLKADAARTTDLTYILPASDPTANQVLAASAPVAGVVTLSWSTPSGGATTWARHFMTMGA